MKFNLSFFSALLFSVVISFSCQESGFMEKANLLHEKVLTIDTHTDTPLQLMLGNLDIGVKNNPSKTRSKIDLPRMKEGGLDAAFWAVFIGQGPLTPEAHEAAKQEAFEIIEKIKSTIDQNSDLAELAYSSDDAYRIKEEDKRAIYIGMENGYPAGGDLSLIDEFYNLGVRYITLCHNGNNNICDSATDDEELHDGLSSFGEKVVKEMNRLGMIIDVSHMSDDSFYDVVNISKAPVVATHSCSRALRDHPRNMSDDMIKMLAEKGGVIQVTMVGSFVKDFASNLERDSAFSVFRKKYENRENLSPEEINKRREEYFALDEKYPRELAKVSDYVDHIDHIVKLVGINYVGIGSDFDGGGQLDGCFDVSEMKNITVELLKRGYNDEDIAKIWGGNFMRVFKDVENASKELN